MPDLSHAFGQDLSVDATGDLATSSGSQLGQERVIRRLLSNPGSVVWHMAYGAGLARFLGRPAAPTRIAAITRSQMYLEASVARIPSPAIAVRALPDGTVIESIRYVDAAGGDSVSLTLPVGG